VLGAQLGILNGPHGHGSGHEPGEAGEHQHPGTGAGAGEPLADPGRRQDAVAGLRDVRAYRPEGPRGRLQPSRLPWSTGRYLLFTQIGPGRTTGRFRGPALPARGQDAAIMLR
jgi:hypothetical protein